MSQSRHTAAAVPIDGEGDVTGRVRWRIEKGIPDVSSPLLLDSIYYLANERGIFTSVRADDGVVLREGRLAANFGELYSSPVAAGGRIYAISITGKAAVIRTGGGAWELLGISELGEDCFATPALAGKSILVRTAGSLLCFRE